MSKLRKADKKNIEDVTALSPLQEGMLFHYLKDRETDYYFEQLCLTITGRIDFNCFKRAWNFVAETNEMLRTRFRWEKVKNPVQVILKKHPVQVVFYDYADNDEKVTEKVRGRLIETLIKDDRKNKFNLNGVPFRITLCKTGEDNYEMIISNHHILYDGWSNGIILKEFFSSYDDFVREKSPVKPFKHKYKEYITFIRGQDGEQQKKYWKGCLEGFEDRLELSVKRKKTAPGESVPADIGRVGLPGCFPGTLKDKLGRAAVDRKITVAALFYSAWAILLMKYNHTADVIFGTTVSGRSAGIKGIENIVGLFINTIPLRVRSCADEKIENLLYRLNKELHEREAYENTSPVNIREYSGLDVRAGEELFDTIVVIENYPLDRVLFTGSGELPGVWPLKADSYSIFETAHYDLTVGITLFDDIKVDFTYNKDLLAGRVIEQLARHFANILEEIADNPGRGIGELEILTEAEKSKILYDFNQTAAAYPRDKTINSLFAEQAARGPFHIAVISGEKKLTYQELDERSNGLAVVLKRKGVKPNTVVGIMAGRSLEMLIGILGILKAGGAYLPLDPGYPPGRVSYMLKDSNAGVLVSEVSEVSEVSKVSEGIEIVSLSELSEEFPTHPTHLTHATHLCYIIYTSGTGGRPKGVMIDHSSVVNRLYWVQERYRLNEGDVILQATSFIFDVSVCEMFRWIPAGGKLCFLPPGGEKEPARIVETIAKNRATTADFVPSMLNLLLDYTDKNGNLKKLSSLRWVFTGVEVVGLNLVKRFNEKLHKVNKTTLINAYGPTESTVDITYFDCSRGSKRDDDVVPIGKPMANVRIYILDRHGNIQPIGVCGQLCAAGKGLARGYLNNPELTAEKFDQDLWDYQDYHDKKNKSFCGGPGGSFFKKSPLAAGGTLYKTGDMARWLPDGNIEFSGRMDQQIKIRGFRVELGEIGARLLKYKEINDVVVTAKDTAEGKYLCAYIVTRQKINISELKDKLALDLPDYMIPSYIVPLEKIPLTVGGNIDRGALPGPGPGIMEAGYTAPVNSLEEKLVSIWSEVLGIEKGVLGTGHNFFKLGGHSLKAVRLISGIEKELNVNVPLEKIFKLPTIKGLSGFIKGLTTGEQLALEPMEEKEYYPLSPGQRRLYFLQQVDKTAAAYNMPWVWLLKGAVDRERMEYTFKRLIRRHESLRTSFITVDEEPVQRVFGETAAGWWSMAGGEAGKNEIEDRIKNFIKPFDLSRGPLLRAGLIKFTHTPDHEYMLMVDVHHIICDGVSVEIVVNEFTASWAGEELRPVKLRYKDYGEWQHSNHMRRLIEYQEKFWLNRYADGPPSLNLPVDYMKPAVRGFEGNTLQFRADGEEYRALKACAHREETTLYMILLAVYNIFLSRICGQEDIMVGTGTAGRRHADLGPVVGMFVNTLVLRNFPRGGYTFKRFLHEVKERTLEAFANQDYPYENLAAAGVKFDTMFAMEDIGDSEIKIPGLEIESYEYPANTAKFDLMLLVSGEKENLSFTFEYSTALFKEETVQGFSGYFKMIAAAAAARPDTGISEIEIISEKERERILFKFNDPESILHYPKDRTIQGLFEEQAEKVPDRIAVIGRARGTGRCALSYRELDKRAGQLAQVLRERGIGPDVIVGLMVGRLLEMITGILGILKAGGAYLPIDPEYPEDRVNYMLADSNAVCPLTARELSDICGGTAGCAPAITPAAHNLHLSLAYVIYTSGSTGKPKGTLTAHYNVVRVVKDTNYIDLNETDVILQLSNYAFDGSIFDIYGALLNGGRLVLAGKETVPDIERLSRLIRAESITAFFTTTALFNAIVDSGLECLAGVRKILFGGERVSEVHVKKAFAFLGPGRLLHVYGPTETTVFASCYEIGRISADADNVPIGKAITATMLYVLNQNNRLQPAGIPGELYIAGTGLARGYLNRPELTAGRFIYLSNHEGTNKSFLGGPGGRFFKKAPLAAGGTLYKTGDLVRWTAGGVIEFLGRIDQQVKIRGFRIEPREIESHLLKHTNIKEAVVMMKKKEPQDNYLCAYVVSDALLAVSELRDYLSKSLPDYMIPSYFVFLDKIPLTINGKVDRKALPEPGSVSEADQYTAPRDEVELKMTALWSGVLGIDKDLIGIDRDFFESGGHSLKASTLAARVHKAFNVSVPLLEIFTNPTVRGLAAFIKKAAVSGHISIRPGEEKEYYPLSPAQKRLYVLQQMDGIDAGMGTVYNIPALWTVEGDVDKKRWEKTFNRLIHRHESLRTSFHLVDNEPVQKIHKEVGLVIDEEKIIQDFVHPFDLSRAPLLRVGLLELPPTGEHTCILMVDMHHIIADGASTGILVSEFMSLYNGEGLPVPGIRYKDFAEWQNSRPVKEFLKSRQEYWQNQFKEEIPVLNLPIDYVRPVVQQFTGSSSAFAINREDTRALNVYAHERGATLYMVLLAAFNLFLAKITNQETIIVGTVVAARRHADLENIIGMFVNTLGLINRLENRVYFHEFLERVNERTLAAFENQDYPFEELVEQAGLARDTGRNPLFDVMFVFQNLDLKDMEIPGLKLKPRKYENLTSKFDLTLNGEEKQGGLHFIVEYCTALFKKTTIQRFINYFKTIISILAANMGKSIKISDIDILSPEEKQRLLIDFNRTEAGYPEGKTIHKLFAEQVERTPDHVALSGEITNITYGELNRRSNRLAHFLRQKGVIPDTVPDTVVALSVNRSIDMIIGITAVLKTGGAYLPIDPEYPQERIDYMLKDSNAAFLLTAGDIQNVLKGTACCAPTIWPETCNPHLSLAYIIYTSGTTGKPKGVMIRHNNVVRLMFNDKFQFDFNDKDVWTLFHSYCFDFSVWEMYGALLYGARLIIIPRMTARDTSLFLELLKKETATILNQTPSAFYRLMEEESKQEKNNLGLKYIIFGGEALNPLKLKAWKTRYPDTRLINMFGITETTVHVTYKEITGREIDAGISNIGKPIPTLRTYVVDSSLNLVPIGVPGELCVGGEGVGRGYLNRPELTEERFCLRRPGGALFEKTAPPGPPRKNFLLVYYLIYKSGDLVRVLDGGDLEYLGRIDQQAKIRGFRIEPGEIENHLTKHPHIKEAVVMMKKKEPQDNYLCAYIVSYSPLAVPGLRDYLSKHLPDYMIPSYFVPLENIPLTPNGKIDRKALPEPDRKKTTTGYTAPRTGTEKILAGLWADILHQDNTTISIDDNFFELGGHSLKAALLTSQILHRLKVKIPLVEIFRTPTIRALAQSIKKSTPDKHTVEPAETREYYTLSSAQRRLYILYRMEEQGIAYNMPTSWFLEGDVNKNKLENTFRQLIRRHESLRTSFHMIKNEMVQKIHKEVELVIGEEKSPEPIIRDFVHPFDLARAPLLRVGLIELPQTTEHTHILMVDMHHIISDGISMGILLKEFMSLYSGETVNLPFIPLTYKDYAQWQSNRKNSEKLKQQETFWVREFQGEIPTADLPTDYKRPPVQSFEGHIVEFHLDREQTQTLKETAAQEGVTLFILLLAITDIFLAKICSQEDIVVGVDTAGRHHPHLQAVIGMFVNTLALRNFPNPHKQFNLWLQEVKERTLNAFDNQDYQFEELVERIEVNRDPGRNPLFDVMFSFMDTADTGLDIQNITLKKGNIKITPYPHEGAAALFDLTLNGREDREGLHFSFQYCTELFKEKTVHRFISFFKQIVSSVTRDRNRPISAIEIITAEEKKQVLFEFNNTGTPLVRDKNYIQLFEKQVTETPDKTAAVFNRHQVTYRRLNEEAGRIAAILKKHGVTANMITAVLLERGIEMLAALLAIFKTGGVYLPLETDYPEERVKNILKDSEAGVLVTGSPVKIVDIQRPAPVPTASPAYIIYTSGSTGKPKGVMIHQLGMLNHLYAKINDLRITGDDIIAQTASACFDISIWQFLAALLVGGTTLIIPRETLLEPVKFLRVLQRGRVTVLESVPSLMTAFIEAAAKESNHTLTHLRWMMATGEPLKVPLVRGWYRVYPCIKLVNAYGPTEAADDVTHYIIHDIPPEDQTSIPIGKPLQNLHIYIVDKNLSLCPVGIKGEICVAGIGVGKGYWKDEPKTKAAFIPNPFLGDIDDNDCAVLYKTGDIGYFRDDGNIECLGRLDLQVKIRGNRIELEEIENRLLNRDSIKEAVVVSRSDENGENYLCAYIGVRGTQPGKNELKEYLLQHVPAYMVPSVFVTMDRLPVTSSGKIDRKALPEPGPVHDREYTAPGTGIEKKIAAVWQEVLKRDKIGVNDDFFSMGGSSVTIIQVSTRLREVFNRDLPVVKLFEYTTIRALANYLEQQKEILEEEMADFDLFQYQSMDILEQTMEIIKNTE
jgi:amino acid adenylation domain-containing protein